MGAYKNRLIATGDSFNRTPTHEEVIAHMPTTTHTITCIQDALEATGKVHSVGTDAEVLTLIYEARHKLHLALAAVQGPYSHLEGR
jgi:hypothetical protein